MPERQVDQRHAVILRHHIRTVGHATRCRARLARLLLSRLAQLHPPPVSWAFEPGALLVDNRVAMTPVVELAGARKRFGAVEALKGVDLTIGAGELVALLGPNGAGKTTSISLMLSLRRPTTGAARLFGLDPADRRARSRCGVMLQESGTTGVLTVREIVDLFRAYYPASLPAERAIALAGLEAKANARIATLSGGERQRLYFALAVCGDPEALFLDEPTVGMDVEARRGVLASVRALSNAGKTIVLTTHYLEEADQLAHRIVVIDHGVVIADATPREIKARIPSKRVNFSS